MTLALKIGFPDDRLADVQRSSTRSKGASSAAEEFLIAPVFTNPGQAPVVAYLQVIATVRGKSRVVQTAYLQLGGRSGRVTLTDCSKSVELTFFERQLLEQEGESLEGGVGPDDGEEMLEEGGAQLDLEDFADESETEG